MEISLANQTDTFTPFHPRLPNIVAMVETQRPNIDICFDSLSPSVPPGQKAARFPHPTLPQPHNLNTLECEGNLASPSSVQQSILPSVS